ncbi:hypothetical protein GQ607_017718 [Colletotrichum asianum]|uniref:Uncharacterized protein n=1 Tax=Colletotrichum asianum TaxID=702518 RepID=A0A8H3VWJ7_9PEZI|nr:hypothetical protein GQ607_017718 [Colletotrichum asianum]
MPAILLKGPKKKTKIRTLRIASRFHQPLPGWPRKGMPVLMAFFAASRTILPKSAKVSPEVYSAENKISWIRTIPRSSPFRPKPSLRDTSIVSLIMLP